MLLSVERFRTCQQTRLFHNFCSEFSSPLQGRWVERRCDSSCELISGEVFVWNRSRSCPSLCNHRTPKWLVPKKGHHHCWSAQRDSSSCRARAAMVDNAGNAFEQPVMWAISYHEDVPWDSNLLSSKPPPTF